MELVLIGFGGLMALPLVILPIAIMAERARKERLRDWAAVNGWTFAVWPSARWTSRLPGRRRNRLGVTMTGMLGGRWVTVAEYSYETTSGSGDSETTHRHYYIVVVVLLERSYPPVSVIGRGSISRLGRAMFGDKPTDTGNGWFDARFRIIAGDAHYAHWAVGKPLIDAHLAGAVPLWSLVGQDLLYYFPGRLRDPHAIPAYAAPLIRVADRLGR